MCTRETQVSARLFKISRAKKEMSMSKQKGKHRKWNMMKGKSKLTDSFLSDQQTGVRAVM